MPFSTFPTKERRLCDGDLADERRVGGEDAPHPEEREGDDQEAGDGATAHGDLDSLDEAAPRRGCRADIRLDGDEHADDARGHRAGSPDDEGDACQDPDRQTRQLRHVGDIGRFDDADDDADDDRSDHSQDADRRVLAAEEGCRALIDGAGHVLHRLRPRVARQDVSGQVEREQDGDDARRQDDQLE
jgi:hypothetical protein